MSRPSVITEEQILGAARTVFLERGISATTAEVARRAGIAEGSIFKRFKTKVDLFRAAMQPAMEDPEWLKVLAHRSADGDLRQTLVDVGLRAIDFFRQVVPLHMMSWSNPACVEKPPVNSPALRTLKRLTAFFEGEMRAGRLRRHDPEVVARAFLGSMHNYVFFETVFKAHDELPLPAESFVRGLVNLLFTGMERK